MAEWRVYIHTKTHTPQLYAKENRLLDSYLHRKVGDIDWQELEREVQRIMRKNERKEWALSQYPQLYNIGLAEQEYRTKQLKALEEKASEDISLLKVLCKLSNGVGVVQI